MKRLGIHRVDGRSYWFAGYFNQFDRELMIRYAGQARADRFHETFGGQIPFAEARVVRVFDPDPVAARQFAETFNVTAAQTLDEFADGLDGVIVPFPAGGPARDYAVIAPLVERGIPLFLDRIILEQSDLLKTLCALATKRRAPLHVTCFLRYVTELLLPSGIMFAQTVAASATGDPAGYGADLLDLVDELMRGEPTSMVKEGNTEHHVVRIRYADGRDATVELFRGAKHPMQVTASGAGWTRSLQLDGSQNHFAAKRQFEAFLRSIETREPPIPYERIHRNAAILHGRPGA